ncbi:MAG: glycosyltransferase [Thermoanaerobaculum sp.]
MALARVTAVIANPKAPSYRLRLASLAPFARAAGLELATVVLPRKPEWLRVLRLAQAFRSSSVLLFSKLKLVLGEDLLVRRWCPLWVLDVDDAVMVGKPKRHGDPPDQAFWRRRRFARMVRQCALVVAGSRELARQVEPLGAPVVVCPTPVDLSRYPEATPASKGEPVLAWIGLGKNLRYLEDLDGVLGALSQRFSFRLRVISDRRPRLSSVAVELVPWSEATEGEALASTHVGLAPLTDDLWTRGKGGYRCIQYAAAGLPCVASPVGANREVVVPGETGFWATTPAEWVERLSELLENPGLRASLGGNARRRAATLYDLPKLAPRYVEWLRGLVTLRPFRGSLGVENDQKR